MLLNKIKKTKNRFRAYPTRQAVQTSGSTAGSITGFLMNERDFDSTVHIYNSQKPDRMCHYK